LIRRAPATLDPSAALVGVDGLDESPLPRPGPRPGAVPLRLAPEAAERIREEIARAGGREVCFLASVTAERQVVDPRAVARGNYDAVIAAAFDEPQGGVMIHNHPSGLLEPSAADFGVAARLWEEGLGSAITDNGATTLYVVIEPPAPKVVTPLDLDELDARLAPGGPLADRHPAYEDRAGQRTMMRHVADAYNEGGILMVEAGTGTGKSLAYLLPAAEWAVRNEERTVVSTATINLQGQLADKDLPLVAGLVDGDLTWALVKGRGNYISIRRARLAAGGAGDLFEQDRSRELQSLLDWIGTTEDGSLSDLPFVPTDEVWEEVRSDPDICLRGKCPHFQACFYQRSRQRAASARIVVANHHLLFTDLAVRRATQNWTQSAVLPAYTRVVLDEAHNVEDAATSHLGVEVTRSGLFRLLARLDRRGKGVLTAVQEALSGSQGREAELKHRIEEEVRPALDEARSALELFVDVLEAEVIEHAAAEGESVRIGGEGDEAVPEPVDDPAVRERLHALLNALQDLEREVGRLRRGLESDEALEERLEGRLLDLKSAERRLGASQVALRLVLEPGEQAEHYVRWLEVRGRGRQRNLALAAAPIELGPLLRESFFAKMETAVLASATLATQRRFDFLRDRLGLDAVGLAGLERPPRTIEALVPSPFDFARQTVLAVPTDLADPHTGSAQLQEDTARVVEALARRTGGGLFVLFTSHRALRRVAAILRDRAVDVRWPLFVQGEDDRVRLLAGFVRHGHGILLGTSSFWEGVDVPGDPLRGLIIQKLPFRVPTEPVTAARVEALEARGGNAFWAYMLPLAALRLKQGFGRLVRSRTDHGAVVLLDDRILRKRYGRYLRDSLPDAPLVKGPWSDIERALERFYAGQ
jgi:ATP-dependent DNA helicase DinG